MEKNDINQFKNRALNSLENILKFAAFVSYAEETSNVYSLIKNKKILKNYNKQWCELEIVNALALCEWEEDGRPREWSDKWESKYRKAATDATEKLLDILK